MDWLFVFFAAVLLPVFAWKLNAVATGTNLYTYKGSDMS
jgi:hypothetical protein